MIWFFEGGTEIVYSVKEVDVPKDYTDNVETGTDGNFTLTNSHTPATVEKSVTRFGMITTTKTVSVLQKLKCSYMPTVLLWEVRLS